jgi:hypothetical protein
MSTIPTVRPPGTTGQVWQEPADDDFSLAFAAWALLLTVGVLVALVAALWLLVAVLRGGA